MTNTPTRPAQALMTAAFALALGAGAAQAQGLTVLPVSIVMAPGQMSASLTLVNHSDKETAFQVRSFAWSQSGPDEMLTPTEELMASPPMATMAPGAIQVVHLALRRAATSREASYRILLDQAPPPPAPGVVRIALRQSIPVFAQPMARTASKMQWRVETAGGKATLVAMNSGSRHEMVRGIALAGPGGASSAVDSLASPYILPGATRRWQLLTPTLASAPGGTVRLTGTADGGASDQRVPINASR